MHEPLAILPFFYRLFQFLGFFIAMAGGRYGLISFSETNVSFRTKFIFISILE
jgi:hypothetical protein